jgi:HAMP domain-containing protein
MKKYSIYFIVFVIFAALIGVSFISIYFSVTQHRKDLLETAINEKIRLAETINETIASPFWFYRMALVPGLEKAFIAEMAKFKDVRYIRIVKPDGTIYQSSIEAEWGKSIEISKIKEFLASKEGLIKDEIFKGEKIKTIIYPGYEDKIIWIGFSLKSIEETTKAILFRDITVTMGGLVFTILVLFIILRTIVNPLRKMTVVCQEVRKGNLDAEINIKSKTEIGELATTFNEMLKDLKKSHTALEEAKTVLEIKVAARTRELRELAEQREEIIKQRTKELREKIEELERFQRLAVGRELKMIELKKKIRELEKRKK